MGVRAGTAVRQETLSIRLILRTKRAKHLDEVKVGKTAGQLLVHMRDKAARTGTGRAPGSGYDREDTGRSTAKTGSGSECSDAPPISISRRKRQVTWEQGRMGGTEGLGVCR